MPGRCRDEDRTRLRGARGRARGEHSGGRPRGRGAHRAGRRVERPLGLRRYGERDDRARPSAPARARSGDRRRRARGGGRAPPGAPAEPARRSVRDRDIGGGLPVRRRRDRARGVVGARASSGRRILRRTRIRGDRLAALVAWWPYERPYGAPRRRHPLVVRRGDRHAAPRRERSHRPTSSRGPRVTARRSRDTRRHRARRRRGDRHRRHRCGHRARATSRRVRPGRGDRGDARCGSRALDRGDPRGHRAAHWRRGRARRRDRFRRPRRSARDPADPRRRARATRPRELSPRRGDARPRRHRGADRALARRAARRRRHRACRWAVLPRSPAPPATADAGMTALAPRAVVAGYLDREVLHDSDICVGAGEVVCLVGPNGAGKSTLLRALAGLLVPRSGDVRLDGRDLRSLARREIARRIAVVPQVFETLFPFTVREVVALGRTARLSLFGRASAADRAAVDRALDELALLALADRTITEISGGERQRAVLAMALAQEGDVLLLDEPTAHLDPAHQLATLALVRRLARTRGLAVVAVLHDLNLAASAATRIVVIEHGRVVVDAPPLDALTPEVVGRVFGAGLEVERRGGRPLVVPGALP